MDHFPGSNYLLIIGNWGNPRNNLNQVETLVQQVQQQPASLRGPIAHTQ
jgi:hypothetical protein